MLITGAMLRQAREATGVSLSEMARKIFRDKGYLSRIETRHGAVPDHIVEQYEHVLGVDMNRRDLLAGLGVGAVLPGAVVDAIRRGIDQESAEPLSVEDWMAKVDAYAADAMKIGTSEMQVRLASDLVLLQSRLTEPRMWGVAARMMVLHGAPLVSLTDIAATEHWYRSATTAADRSEDISVRVWVRGRSALNMAHPSASLRGCRALASEAVELPAKASVGKLTALISLANVAALSGNAAESRAKLHEAKQTFEVVGSTGHVASEYVVPEWRMNVDESLVLSRLGDCAAENAHEQAAATIPAEFSRFATHVDLHRGLALAKAGDRIGGVAHARDALSRLPVGKHSVALRRLLTEVAS